MHFMHSWHTFFLIFFYFFCCCCSVTRLCPTVCDPMDCSMQGFSVLHYLPEFGQTHVHWIGHAIQPYHLLWPPFPPSLSLYQHQGIFQWVGSSYQVAKVLELQLQQNPSNEYSGLISFRIDWFYLLAVQGTLQSLLQHHSSKELILGCMSPSSNRSISLPAFKAKELERVVFMYFLSVS